MDEFEAVEIVGEPDPVHVNLSRAVVDRLRGLGLGTLRPSPSATPADWRQWLDALKDPIPQVLGSAPAGEVGSCPSCGDALTVRRGKFGEFVGCSGYPDCKYTRNT